MEREASFLRCSKLSCYSEFNKMVHALSVHSKGETVSTLHPPRKGTSAEYNFYQTLSIMLNQVLSNPHCESQRHELQMIFQWFTLNKPLMPQKIKPRSRKPQLVLTTQWNPLASSRPQTAPAAIGYASSTCKSPICPPPTPALPTFTSSFMTRSMQVQFHNRPATQPLTVRDDWSIDGRRMGEIILQSNPTIQRPNRTVRSVQHNDSGGLSSAISIQGMHQSTSELTSGTIYANASGIAAQMTLERMMSSWRRSLIAPERTGQYQLQKNIVDNNHCVTNETVERDPQETQPKSQTFKKLDTISEGIELDQDIEERQIITGDVNVKKSDLSTVGHEIQEPHDKDEMKDKEIQVPIVTIEAKKQTQVLRAEKMSNSRLTSSASSLSCRKAHQVQIVSLDLPEMSTQIKRTRTPKSLVPIVAGFNKQHYRPRTVA